VVAQARGRCGETLGVKQIGEIRRGIRLGLTANDIPTVHDLQRLAIGCHDKRKPAAVAQPDIFEVAHQSG
jgi:hypothetical protein